MLLVPRAVAAGPLEDAFAAERRHDYAAALRLWRPLADHGNPIAQFHLGRMYELAEGVGEDAEG